jgi:hypothetical protein
MTKLLTKIIKCIIILIIIICWSNLIFLIKICKIKTIFLDLIQLIRFKMYHKHSKTNLKLQKMISRVKLEILIKLIS